MKEWLMNNLKPIKIVSGIGTVILAGVGIVTDYLQHEVDYQRMSQEFGEKLVEAAKKVSK